MGQISWCLWAPLVLLAIVSHVPTNAQDQGKYFFFFSNQLSLCLSPLHPPYPAFQASSFPLCPPHPTFLCFYVFHHFPPWPSNLFPSVPSITHLSFLPLNLPSPLCPPLSHSVSSLTPFLHLSSLCCLTVWWAGSVQSDQIMLMIISPPYHHAISPWQPGNDCNPAADAATLQKGFNKCVVTLCFKLWWFAAQCGAQYTTLQCASQSTSPQQTWFNQSDSHQNVGSCLFLVMDVKNLDASLTRNTHLSFSWTYCMLIHQYVALLAYHVLKLNRCVFFWTRLSCSDMLHNIY